MLLFLGSGVSRASGLPGVSKITNQLLNGVYFHDIEQPGKFYHANEIFGKNVEQVDKIQRFLKVLKKTDEYYLKNIAPYPSGGSYKFSGSVYRKETSYEDLFYLCEQIRQNGVGLTDDAMIGALVDKIEAEAGKLLEGGVREQRLVSLYHLSKTTLGFIEWVVSSSLHTVQIEGLDLIIELARSPLIQKLDIVTLNHDILVERLLRDNNISYIDGFGPIDGDLRLYDDDLYDTESDQIRIFKPHGSVDWYRVRGLSYPAIFCGKDIQNCHLKNGKIKKIDIKTPAFLSGTNKILSYNRDIYSEIFYRVHQVFREQRSVIMSGYGWGDTAINFRIMNWLGYSKENAILLLHEDPEEVRDRSLQLSEEYTYLVNSGRLLLHKAWLEHSQLPELKALWFETNCELVNLEYQ